METLVDRNLVTVPRWRRVLTLALLAAVPAVLARGQAPGPGTYTPAQVEPREHAAYVLPDGSIQIVTSSKLAGVVRALNTLFIATHPAVRFKVLEGDNYSAMAALTFDRTAFAPLASEYTRIGLGDNLKIAAEPIGLRIAHASVSPGNGLPMLGVIVNSSNPISNLSMTQLTRMFAVGGPVGDIATWGQASVAGVLADREVHPIGPLASDYMDSEDPQAGEFLSTDKMSGLNMNHRYVGAARYSDVIQRVKEDPAAIGIAALNGSLDGVKLVALRNDTGSPSRGSAADIAAGRYPLDRFVYIYLRIGKGTPIDTFAKEYIRMVLSDEGQRAIAGETAGYIPLNAGELAEERARLDQ
ncbi:MAG TPA: substrate-binding domain-containing protein [Acidobacteriaceae bacterium]